VVSLLPQEPDWAAIVALYDALLALKGSAVVAITRGRARRALERSARRHSRDADARRRLPKPACAPSASDRSRGAPVPAG
jgi:hypothetical protein